MQQAQDTFVAQMDDGSQVRVAKGEFLPEGHELVRRDQACGGLLFRQVYLADDEQPKPARGRAAK
jgi:hypothetical protein